jgi:hypothetical protein
VITAPLRPRQRQEPGIAAAGRLAHQGTPYDTSLSFATTTHLWPLSDPPSREHPRSAYQAALGDRPGQFRDRALASSMLDSPCQGSRTGLTPPISTSVPSTPGRSARFARAAPDTPTRRQPVRLGECSHSRSHPCPFRWPSMATGRHPQKRPSSPALCRHAMSPVINAPMAAPAQELDVRPPLMPEPRIRPMVDRYRPSAV